MSNSLQTHGLQHAMLPCPSLSWSLFRLMSIEMMMPSNHLILCHPVHLPPSIFPSITVFSNELALHIRWPNIGTSASVCPMNIQGCFPLELTDLLAVQGDSQESSPVPQFESISSSVHNFLLWVMLKQCEIPAVPVGCMG